MSIEKVKKYFAEIGEPERVIEFGDTAVDIKTALNAGFLPIGVTWGFRSRSELEDSGAKIIIDYPTEILEQIEFGGN